MKKLVCVLIFCIGVFSSCKEASVFENKVYFTGTEASDTRQLVVDGVPSEVAFSVTLADMIGGAVEVEIAAEDALVEAYNSKNHKNYKTMPAGSFNLSASTLTIEPDNLRSNPAKVVITDDSRFEEGASYLIPVTIKSVKGGVSVLGAAKTVYFVVIKTIVTQACNLRGNFFFRVDFSKNNDASLKSLPGCTMETRFYCTNTMTANPWISSIMGLEENWLLRMGDAHNIPDNSIQVAGKGSNVTAPSPTSYGEWHHLAIVFENGTNKLYIDGDLVGQGTHPGSADAPGCINLTDVYADPCFSIGISANATARRWNGYFSEMRVWKKARSRADIMNNMCYVDPAHPDLVAYWRFDGSKTTATVSYGAPAAGNSGEYDVILDHTGNGYDAIPYTAAYSATNLPQPLTTLFTNTANWVDNVKCPN